MEEQPRLRREARAAALEGRCGGFTQQAAEQPQQIDKMSFLWRGNGLSETLVGRLPKFQHQEEVAGGAVWHGQRLVAEAAQDHFQIGLDHF